MSGVRALGTVLWVVSSVAIVSMLSLDAWLYRTGEPDWDLGTVRGLKLSLRISDDGLLLHANDQTFAAPIRWGSGIVTAQAQPIGEGVWVTGRVCFGRTEHAGSHQRFCFQLTPDLSLEKVETSARYDPDRTNLHMKAAVLLGPVFLLGLGLRRWGTSPGERSQRASSADSSQDGDPASH